MNTQTIASVSFDHRSKPSIILQQLEAIFNRTMAFCNEHQLKINAAKTQLLMVKTPSRTLPTELELVLDGCSIKPEPAVKLLGMTIDQHLTFSPHIDRIVKKSHGLLAMLYRAAPFLPRELLKLTYTSLIRSQLEFGSAILAPIAKSHLSKLDVIQKMAARTICGAPRHAHAAPLLVSLQLESLEARRESLSSW